MKYSASFAILAFVLACGRAPENHRGHASIALSQLSAPLVNSVSDLPSCTNANGNELVFVKETKLFKICKDQTWRDVLAADAVPGDLRVAEVAKIQGSDVDLCPDSKEMFCYFEGGEYLRYSDGVVKYSGRVIRKTSTQNMDDSLRSETSDMLSTQMSQLPTSDASHVKILSDVDFKGISTSIWLVHDALTKTFSVVVDSNQDGDVSEADEVLFPLELTDY